MRLLEALAEELSDLEESLLKKVIFNGQTFVNGRQVRDPSFVC